MVIQKIGESTIEVVGTDGNSRVYSQCLTDLNGNPMNDSLVDGVNYVKFEFRYYKKGDIITAVVPDPTFSDNTFDI